ncbi:MAG: tetratricopeptide repeat protein [Pyrinomonadaceae bacterium]
MKYQAVGTVVLLFIISLSATAQNKDVVLQQYIASESICKASSKAENWETAETECNNALADAVKLPARYKREKMNALTNYGFALFSQSKFDKAQVNFSKALTIAKSFLTTSSTDLGFAYFNVARAYQGMASITGKYIDPAEINYLQAEKIYRTAYSKATDPKTKADAKELLRKPIVLLNYIATLRGDAAKVRATEARLKELEDPK